MRWPLLPQNSRPCFIAHFCSCTSTHLSGSAHYVPPSAYRNSVGILAAFAVAGFRHAMLLLDGCSSIMTPAVWSMQRQIFPLATAANSGARRTGGGFVADGWQKFTQQRPHAPTDYMEALQPMGSLITQQAWLNPLPRCWCNQRQCNWSRRCDDSFSCPCASCFAQRFTPRQEWKLWIAWELRREWLRPIAPRLLAVYLCRSAVWHYDVGLSRPGDYFRVVALLVSNLINHSDALLYSVNSQ